MSDPTIDLQEQINASWNATAANAQGQPHHTVRDDDERQIWLDTLRTLLPPAPADVLDIGTGTGFRALMCADLGHRVTGIDMSESMLNDARVMAAERAKAGLATYPPVFRVGNGNAPDLPPGSLDVVGNRNVIWTLLDPANAFKNWWALLRPGGRVLAIHGVPAQPEEVAVARLAKPDKYYTDDVKERLLPIRFRPTFDPALPYLRAAGFTDINVTHLDALEQYSREHDPDERIRTWLGLTAMRPK
jgi:SAM-dependent methyltransferase